MRQIESVAAPAKPKRGFGNKIINFSHDLAHGLGENVVEPAINISQYHTFENPSNHRRKIDNQMFRVFDRAATTLKADRTSSILLFSQLVLAVALGEHVPFPLQWTPLPHEFTAIPLPFNVHIDIPFPPGDILNHIPGVHLPTEFKSDGPFWPLFTSDIIMAGAVNIPNARRAFKERRYGKAFLDTLSVPGAFTHIPVVFNSFWYELAFRPAERKAGQSYAEKVGYVLDGENAPATDGYTHQPKGRVDKFLNRFKWMRDLRKMSTGQTHIKQEDRHIFADASAKQLTDKRPREWWQAHLEAVKTDIQTNTKLGLPHERERVAHHGEKSNGRKLSPRRLWHVGWKKYHQHMIDRLEEKEEAVEAAEHFLRHATPKYQPMS